MKNRFVHYGLVLLVIAAISAGILGLVNDFTKTVIAANNEKTQNAAKQEVLAAAAKFDDSEAVESDGLKFIPGYNAEGTKVGYVTTVATPGYGGDITFILGINLDGSISGLRIVNQSETPGLGAKIGGIEWQDHWVGKDVSYEFNKSADAFAGATISPRAVYTGIIKALNAFKDGGMN
ncbi:Na(+)-translocating ferredoxin:NAD(+) oxidoreductase complex subunit G [Fusobacterium sp. DD29]|uniref:RnfABCDGE type electron transport complex subunit G n=1 Tax=unclassified Fusobacterium TaxID=2648384 RepID=UPI001B8BF517|nr:MULTISPECIES: RnfABCDGE type electron transport complex subunit G [unclassified Fusobacterium]MBR8700754.1 Na(+)-translocating ferredoxin:NAD(+) oxidoreductase complex subunit G [Fusobacterium sp. DD45]MBR8710533.1 Na(+)-translocating ferredoxin:NAD(+) oxidoreductase complex subunit G [Fusobacterium sp. DD28]MBR8749122.1 Na(+)-translocating ferredoxin:NAD(+) oxidoreductase complex subunit G [Fusobacterium sp. DD29]MBR8751117.1 Na(+)-translocating ferredoxin:NAD(+) oxidoreductase complex subu